MTDRRDLDAGSRQPLAVTGAEVEIPAGIGQGRALSTSLRLGPGTWEIFSGKLDTQTRLLTHPDPADPTWPAVLRIRHGTGRAVWLEDLPMTARGMRVTRTGDYLEVSVLVPTTETMQQPSVALLVASQPIVRPEDSWRSENGLSDPATGRRVFPVPIGAYALQMGANGITVLRWRDASGFLICAITPATALQHDAVAVPSTATEAEVQSSLSNRIVVSWKVLG